MVSPAATLAAPPVTDSLYIQTRPAMGTDFSIYLYAANRQTSAGLFEAAFEEIARVEGLLSTYRPESELSRINREAASASVVTDGEMASLIDNVLTWSIRTRRAFDPTVGALLDTWGFRAVRSTIPSEAEIQEALGKTGADKVELERASRSVSFTVPGLWLDSGAFGKGYALDRAASVLSLNGVRSALLESGQSTYVALDAPPGRNGWTISVPDPDRPDSTLDTILISNRAISTSGGSHRFVVFAGHRYVHVLDPRSGRPVEGTSLASVVARDGLESDILSTAAFVLGQDDGAKLIRSLPDVGGLILSGGATAGGIASRAEKIRWDEPRTEFRKDHIDE